MNSPVKALRKALDPLELYHGTTNDGNPLTYDRFPADN